MIPEDEIDINSVSVQQLQDECFNDSNIHVDVLRLDKIHPVISGNKWFKLKYYIQQAIDTNCNAVATFGGAFSNHIIATAYACNLQKIPCTGFIRGEKPKHLSKTLLDTQALHMQLEFLSRDEYKNKQTIIYKNASVFFIPEGGYGKTGAKGAAEILQLVPGLSTYNYIICAVGTGTMLAGIVNAALPHQQCIGISVMKNNFSLENQIRLLINKQTVNCVQLLHDYHFGGYARYTQVLLDFINKTWQAHSLPLDFVYTAKTLFAVYNLAEKKYFASGSKILFIHSGGLQGNRSLAVNIHFQF